jgi:hypothetical protein
MDMRIDEARDDKSAIELDFLRLGINVGFNRGNEAAAHANIARDLILPRDVCLAQYQIKRHC